MLGSVISASTSIALVAKRVKKLCRYLRRIVRSSPRFRIRWQASASETIASSKALWASEQVLCLGRSSTYMSVICLLDFFSSFTLSRWLLSSPTSFFPFPLVLSFYLSLSTSLFLSLSSYLSFLALSLSLSLSLPLLSFLFRLFLCNQTCVKARHTRTMRTDACSRSSDVNSLALPWSRQWVMMRMGRWKRADDKARSHLQDVF